MAKMIWPLLGLLCVSPAFAEAAASMFQVLDKPPPGFEDLAEPQQNQVDIYYGGRVLGATLATFTPETIEFDNPHAITEAIPYLKDEVLAEVTQAFSGPLAHNADRLCMRPGQPAGCGRLSPEIAGIIFDMDRFKAEVFINSGLLQPQAAQVARYLPPPSGTYSLLTTLDGSISDTTAGSPDYSLQLQSVLGMGHGRMRFDGYTGNTQGFHLNTLTAEWDWPDHQLALGMLQATRLRLSRQPELLGIRYGTSLKTRADLHQMYGSQISLFLPYRSAVEVFKGKRYLGGAFYDAGQHVLDTSGFPDGTYDITIRIKNAVTQERREEVRYFVKHEELPPLDTPMYFVEAGIPREQEKGGENYLLHLGTARRVKEYFGYDADLMFNDTEILVGAGIFSIASGRRVRLGGLVSDTGAYGAELLGRLEYRDLTASLGARTLAGSGAQTASSLLSEPFTQLNAGLSLGNFNLHGNWQQRGQADERQYRITPSYRFDLWRGRGWRAELHLEYSQTRDDRLAMLTLRTFYQKSPWLLNGYGKIQGGGDIPPKWNASTQAQYNPPAFRFGKLSNRFGLHHTADTDTLQVQGDYRGGYGGLAAAVEYQRAREDGSRQMLYSGQFSLGAILSRQGLTAGGASTGGSAVIFDLRGTPRGGHFQVFIDGSPSIIVPVGRPMILPLSPYALYRIQIKALAETYARYDTREQEVVLYPGNAVHLIWEVQRIFILIGQVRRVDGTVLSNAEVSGTVEPAYTGEQGVVQAEVWEDSVLSVSGADGTVCRISVPAPGDDDIVSVEELHCK
ncbi:MAG: hypothetical protein GY862_35630 [Gammaproteobacteria bacterium]|nr:hypothetical protein [Gammaproteobacteria bacterium]